MDRFEAMNLLVMIADKGSMSAVSRETGASLTAVSRKIADLEKLIGVRLLIRTTRKLTLTEAGIAYVSAARNILEAVENAEKIAAGEYLTPKGELVITAPTMFGRLHLLPVINRFLARWPEINVRLLLSNRNIDLIEEHVDLAVRIGKLPDSSTVAIQLGEMRTVTCAHPSLLARHGCPEHPLALSSFPCINIENPMPVAGWYYSQEGNERGVQVPVTPRLTVTTPEAAIDAATTATGVVRVLHYQAAEGIRHGNLQVILQNFEPQPVPVSLIYPSRGPTPLKVRKFIDFTVPALRDDLRVISSQN
ncbi:LysR family transcriptional regulator [Enterobacteriaceae bacterium 89]|nr:LysR family transcriptional regulator [Enterobacteriaceae bacterium 89]